MGPKIFSTLSKFPPYTSFTVYIYIYIVMLLRRRWVCIANWIKRIAVNSYR
jgi:hypothetical protein